MGLFLIFSRVSLDSDIGSEKAHTSHPGVISVWRMPTVWDVFVRSILKRWHLLSRMARASDSTDKWAALGYKPWRARGRPGADWHWLSTSSLFNSFPFINLGWEGWSEIASDAIWRNCLFEPPSHPKQAISNPKNKSLTFFCFERTVELSSPTYKIRALYER